MLALAVALSVAVAAPAAARPETGSPRVTVAVLAPWTTVSEIASVLGIAPGLVSAGISEVPPAQTYLDISQGNRINPSLYDTELPDLPVAGGLVAPMPWGEAVRRADAAPADLVPGLLGSTLAAEGVAVDAPRGDPAAVLAVDRAGVVPPEGGPAGLRVVRGGVARLARLERSLRPGDLLIAIAAPGDDNRLLAAGIAGTGFDGDLTSDSTRTDGFVLSTDIAPTILSRLGLEIPDQMNGSEIRAEGSPDPDEVAELAERLDDRPSRDIVVLLPLGVWIVIAALIATLAGGALAALAWRLLALAAVWAPLVLLIAAALDVGEVVSALSVGLGSPVLAALTDRFLGGYRGLAAACAATVGAYAVDVIAGSPFSSLSVLGPDPGYGVRFFGIGNELEAILATLTLAGSGAWLASRRGVSRRSAAGWFAALALLAAAAFAPGRFGADVGAAIVLGVGAATAASLSLGLSLRRTIAVVIGASILGVLALVAVDGLLGGAHLSRSVLGAGEASAVADVFERRVDLMVATFTDPVYPELLAITIVGLAVGFVRSATVLGWFGDSWPFRYGFLGALVGVLVGTIANDSGSVLLVIGTIYLALLAAFAWAANLDGG
jgi:hypothetical protein